MAEGEEKDTAKVEDGKDQQDKDGQQKQAQQASTPAETPMKLAVKTVPTRIVERTLEGNYRVKGTQPFMIGAREYKIIVTGIVRAEDFNEEGISATKLLDPKFDIISARRKESEM